MKMETIWEAVAGVVALIYSIIIWFSFIGAQVFDVPTVISTVVLWAIGVVILVVGAVFIGFTDTQIKAVLKSEASSLWEAIGAIVTVLLTIILWFSYLGLQDFTVTNVINTAVVWLVSVLSINVVAVFVGYIQTTLKTSLTAVVTKAK